MKAETKIRYKAATEGTGDKVREENVYYVTDNSGKTNLLLVRRKDWERIHAKYRRLQKKLEILDAIASGIREVKTMKRKGKELQSLSDFLNER